MPIPNPLTEQPPALSVVVTVRRHTRRPDGTLDPRGDLIRQTVVREAAVKFEEVVANESSISVLIMGKPDAIEGYQPPAGLGN